MSHTESKDPDTFKAKQIFPEYFQCQQKKTGLSLKILGDMKKLNVCLRHHHREQILSLLPSIKRDGFL